MYWRGKLEVGGEGGGGGRAGGNLLGIVCACCSCKANDQLVPACVSHCTGASSGTHQLDAKCTQTSPNRDG